MRKTSLCYIAESCGTDKVTHGYTWVYDKYFSSMKDKELTLLEIGIHKGSSLLMWSRYFNNGKIYGIDDCSGGRMELQNRFPNPTSQNDLMALSAMGFNVRSLSQSNRQGLVDAFKDVEFDIIVDDGSHFQEDQQISLGVLFRFLKPGGHYIIEDTGIFTKESMQDRKDWGFERNWGIRDVENLTDTTLTVCEGYVKNKSLNSPYMNDQEKKYVKENIESMDIYYPGIHNNHWKDTFSWAGDKAVLLGSSAVVIIKKGNSNAT